MRLLALVFLLAPVSAAAATPATIAKWLLDNEPSQVKENCTISRDLNARGKSVYTSAHRAEMISRMVSKGMSYEKAEEFENAMTIAMDKMCPDVK